MGNLSTWHISEFNSDTNVVQRSRSSLQRGLSSNHTWLVFLRSERSETSLCSTSPTQFILECLENLFSSSLVQRIKTNYCSDNHAVLACQCQFAWILLLTMIHTIEAAWISHAIHSFFVPPALLLNIFHLRCAGLTETTCAQCLPLHFDYCFSAALWLILKARETYSGANIKMRRAKNVPVF